MTAYKTNPTKCTAVKADADTCATVTGGYYIDSTPTLRADHEIKPITTDCNKGNTKDTCEGCAAGKYLNSADKTCKDNSTKTKCAAFDGTNCTACESGYYLDASKACVNTNAAWAKNCLTFSDKGYCATCETGYVLVYPVDADKDKKYCVPLGGVCAVEHCEEYPDTFNWGKTFACKTCATGYEVDGLICKSTTAGGDGGTTPGGGTTTASILTPSIATIVLAIISLLAFAL